MAMSARMYFINNPLWKRGLAIYVGIFIFFLLPFNACLAGTFFKDDFESGDMKNSQNGFWWHVGKNTTVSNEKSSDGKYSLRIAYPGVPDGKDSFAEQGFSLGGYYPDLWMKYDVYVPSNYYHRTQSGSANNKAFVHLWAGTYDGENREGPLIGPNFWPVNSGESKIDLWVGCRDNGVRTLDKHYHSEGSVAIVSADRGKWLTIIIHAKYATKANNDGVYELWKIRDGVITKLLDKHDGPWYSTGARGFAEGYLLGWANSGFDNETVFYIDNFEVSTTSLLNNTSSPLNNLAPPNPPKIE